MKAHTVIFTVLISLIFGVSASAETKASDQSNTKPQTSKEQASKSKAPKSVDDLDAFFKRGEDAVKSGNHCFDDKVVAPPKKTESKPIA